ncbi:MAG: HpsJ family protein [Planktothrix sp. GU0601_MAG3]|nr:MAG: HpsJ family protein [Planktothrix sp. GU0601_MAG3]
MKATSSRQFSSTTSLILKLVGVILIFSSLVDFLVILIPPNFLNRGWQISVTSDLVDRGIVPMVGMALVFIAFWMDAATEGNVKPAKPFASLRFWVALLASLLGLLYLLLFPLHLNNTRLARAEALAEISQQATQAQTQLENQLGSPQFQQQIQQKKTQLKDQLAGLAQNPEAMNQALANPGLPPEVRQILEQSKSNPKAVEEFLNQQADNLPTQLLGQIRDRKQETRNPSQNSILKIEFENRN